MLPIRKPETLVQAVDLLLARLDEAGQTTEFINIPEDKVVAYLHHTIGRKIRNEFGLWEEDSVLMKALGESHADDASSVILREAWRQAKARGCIIINKETQE